MIRELGREVIFLLSVSSHTVFPNFCTQKLSKKLRKVTRLLARGRARTRTQVSWTLEGEVQALPYLQPFSCSSLLPMGPFAAPAEIPYGGSPQLLGNHLRHSAVLGGHTVDQR